MNIQELQEASQRLRDNRLFEWFIVSIIVLSALLIGARTYPIPGEVVSVIKWLDVAITLLFLFEIIIRFIATPVKARFFHNG